jgi:hypothetical protein
MKLVVARSVEPTEFFFKGDVYTADCWRPELFLWTHCDGRDFFFRRFDPLDCIGESENKENKTDALNPMRLSHR